MEIPNGVMISGTNIFARPALTKQEAIHRICFIYSRLRDDNSIKGFYAVSYTHLTLPTICSV